MNRSSRELRRAAASIRGCLRGGGRWRAARPLFVSLPSARGIREVGFAWYLGQVRAGGGRPADSPGRSPTVRVWGADLVGRTSLTVAKNCDAMDVNLLFVAAMIAFPAPWSIAGRHRRRRRGAVGREPAADRGPLSDRHPRAARFEFIHAEVFPLVMVVLAVGAFGDLVALVAPGRARARRDPSACRSLSAEPARA